MYWKVSKIRIVQSFLLVRNGIKSEKLCARSVHCYHGIFTSRAFQQTKVINICIMYTYTKNIHIYRHICVFVHICVFACINTCMHIQIHIFKTMNSLVLPNSLYLHEVLTFCHSIFVVSFHSEAPNYWHIYSFTAIVYPRQL